METMESDNRVNALDCNAPLFVVGCYRSGTSLLRLILNAHSKIYIGGETGYIPIFGAQLNAFGDLSIDSNLFTLLHEINKYLKRRVHGWEKLPSAEVIIKRLKKRTFQDIVMNINAYFNTKSTVEIWGDKTPLYVNSIIFLGKLFPISKFINIVRDGRDVAVSALRAKLGGTNLADISLEWNECVLNGMLAERYFGPDRVMTVRYEDLVSDPKKTLLTICNYLKINYEESMLQYYASSDAQTASNIKHHGNVAKPIFSDSVGGYKKTLKQDQRKALELYMWNTLMTYGYDLEFDFMPPPPRYRRYLALLHSWVNLILRSTLLKFTRRIWAPHKKIEANNVLREK
ncbi:MAG: sulfotransferase [Candidatus Brocadia sp.]|uniref:Sulfotransferase domain protein n=1 Tax=Candidatus Brocadia fulgida TaxID=380242 RepID=A0A0M2UX54_9BACT|nr:MAG: Sulfotransferase domain protein [Candidatus Brocadia fulgida]UJS22314.1 MAG: sulfotransferase [Candidatus Brocadia sp.]